MIVKHLIHHVVYEISKKKTFVTLWINVPFMLMISKKRECISKRMKNFQVGLPPHSYFIMSDIGFRDTCYSILNMVGNIRCFIPKIIW